EREVRRSSTARFCEGPSWCAIPSQGCRAFRHVLHAAPRVQAEAPAAPGVCERVTGRLADSAERSRGVRLATNARRKAAGARGLEQGGAEGRRSSKLHRRSEEGGTAVSQ